MADFLYPTGERIFQLEELEVPPINYALFLTEAADEFKRLILQRGGVQTLEELGEKYLREMKEANPDKPEEELMGDSPMGISFSGQLKFLKPEPSDRIPLQVYRSWEHTEDFLSPYLGGTALSLSDYPTQLAKVVETITRELDKRYFERQGFLFNHLFKVSEDDTSENPDIYEFLKGFEFTLHLQSVPSGLLEVDIALRDYGAVSKDNFDCMNTIPAISIQAKTLGGQLDFPQAVVEALEKVVTKFYKVNDVEHRQSYVVSRRLGQGEGNQS